MALPVALGGALVALGALGGLRLRLRDPPGPPRCVGVGENPPKKGRGPPKREADTPTLGLWGAK